jgi:hypothetical protein
VRFVDTDLETFPAGGHVKELEMDEMAGVLPQVACDLVSYRQ